MGRGRIIRALSGFYYVHDGAAVWACRAAGIFRNRGESPLVGDDVNFDITDVRDKEGSVTAIHPRKNVLVRPPAANVDQALVFFASADPDPNFGVLDRFLIAMERYGVPSILCFNKSDLASREEEIRLIYRNTGYDIRFISVLRDEGVEELLPLLQGKTTVLAGPSGAGKSSLMNRIVPSAEARTGEVSARIGRGKQTTRHVEIYAAGPDTYIMDTPGFTSFTLLDMQPEEVRDYFPEMAEPSADCRFPDCIHIGEPDCGVKQAVQDGRISGERYRCYCSLVAECREQKRY